MQEVFEKIIEKLEEEAERWEDSGKEYKDKCEIAVGRGLRNAIEIVKQAAAEYNNDWTLCSDHPPKESGHFLVTYHEWSDGNYLPKYDNTYVRRLHYQKNERFTGWNFPHQLDKKAELDVHREVIAWQPLPEPYQQQELQLQPTTQMTDMLKEPDDLTR